MLCKPSRYITNGPIHGTGAMGTEPTHDTPHHHTIFDRKRPAVGEFRQPHTRNASTLLITNPVMLLVKHVQACTGDI